MDVKGESEAPKGDEHGDDDGFHGERTGHDDVDREQGDGDDDKAESPETVDNRIVFVHLGDDECDVEGDECCDECP